jgi:hypothetical protein
LPNKNPAQLAKLDAIIQHKIKVKDIGKARKIQQNLCSRLVSKQFKHKSFSYF